MWFTKNGEKKQTTLKHWVLLGVIALLVLAGILPPLVNIGRYKRSIAAGISNSIGRPVHMSSISLQLLPLPNFEISDFVVDERPEFGNEPILRASSVVAYPRLSSLWRRKLEIARIDFDEASLNLVQGADGTWNFGSILTQAANRPEAPTGQRHPGAAPRFPYIEATNSRINFKRGNEKKPLSFLNADLSVWLENANEWGLHFKAQPVRTDLVLDMADTGILRIDGSLHRASSLNQMPLKLDARWTAAPLGQLSRLTLGEDIGWRGDLDIRAEITGSADSARIAATATVNGLHRAEFVPAAPLDLAASCQAWYKKESESLEDLSCSSPVDSGELDLTGYLRNLRTQSQTALDLKIDRVPASAALAALQEVRDGLGRDLRVVGTMNGGFHYLSSPGRSYELSGAMGTSTLTLIPPDSGRPVVLSPVRLAFEGRAPSTSATNPPALLLQPIRLVIGASAPLIVDGRLTPAGFDIHLNGSGAIGRLRGLSKIVAWPASPENAGTSGPAATLGSSGTAVLDLSLRGPWLLPVSDSEAPVTPFVTSGSISIKNAELTASYFPRPVKILSAQGFVSPSGVSWIDASINTGKIEADGSLSYPTQCNAGTPCAGRFQITTPSIDLGQLQAALEGGGSDSELLHEIMKHIDRTPTEWPSLSGTLQIGSLTAAKAVLHDVIADVAISGSSLQVRSLDGRLFNGAVHLTGALDASGDQPKYKVDAQLSGASPAALADLFAENWGSGQIEISTQLTLAGYSLQDLISSATGTLRWNWTKGTLAAQSGLPPAAQPLFHFDHWHGDASVANSILTIDHSVVEHGATAVPLSGTVTFNRELDLKNDSQSNGFSVTGTLEHPRVKPTPEAVAASVD